MLWIIPHLAVGGPHVVTGDGWDPAPLILAIGVAMVLRRAGIPLRGPALLSALLAGLLLDLVTDVLDLSFAIAVAALGIAFAVVALRRIPTG